MKVLMEFSTINYKMWHSVAKRLNELYPGSTFAIILGAHGNEAWKYLTGQKDVKYEFILSNQEIQEEAFRSEVDFDELKKFEESLPYKSLWRVIAADRNLGNKFMHGTIWCNSFVDPNISQENIFKVFSGLLKKYRSIFDDFQPTLFLPAICMGNISVFIYEQLCKERNIPYIAPTSVRIKDIFAFAGDAQLRFPQIEDTYQQIYEGKLDIELSSAEKLYEEIIGELEDPQYFDRNHSFFNIKKLNSFWYKVRFILSIVKNILGELWRWSSCKIHRKTIYKYSHTFRMLLKNISYRIHQKYQNFQLLNPSFVKPLNLNQRYIYYPLHINPEYSTQIQGTMWIDQVCLIEILAKSIPFDWKVYVKEHPAMLVCSARPFDFYKQIQRFPNVRLIPIDADMHQLISNAEMVAVITGTSGWEAIQRGKFVITFADNLYDVLDLSRRCASVDTLSEDIYSELQRMKHISTAERKRRLVCFLAAVLFHGFKISYPQQFCYSKKGTDEEYELIGRETADALKRHIEYLQINKSYKLVC